MRYARPVKAIKQAVFVFALAGCVSSTPAPLPGGGTSDASMPAPADGGIADTSTPPPPVDAQAGFRSLFDGVGLASHWDRYLGIPIGETAALGLENDPRGVYSVVMEDGEPAIRISGEVWGALISKEELSDFELRLEYKFGTLVYPPLNAFDSGVMVLSTGALGAVNAGGDALSNPVGSGAFMVSMEYQLVNGDIGANYNLGPIGKLPGLRTVLKERPTGWNQIGIVVRGASSEHFLNGQHVDNGSGYELRMPGQPAVPLTKGKIQLQSEGCEIYFRRIQVRPAK